MGDAYEGEKAEGSKEEPAGVYGDESPEPYVLDDDDVGDIGDAKIDRRKSDYTRLISIKIDGGKVAKRTCRLASKLYAPLRLGM